MKCVLCGGKLEKKLVEEEVTAGKDRILVEMEVEVCVNCHEKYFAEGQINELLDLKEAKDMKEFRLKEVGKVYQLG